MFSPPLRTLRLFALPPFIRIHPLTDCMPLLSLSLAAAFGNLVFWKVHRSGGHFASHERPEAFAADLREMFGRGGPAYGVVPSTLR